MLDRAYSLLEVKGFDPARRTITGIASTPAPDRRDDILEPSGATFRNPIPLLLHHDQQRPVGDATLTATADAILFEARLATVETPGPLRDRLEETWQLLTAGLLKAVSVGFRPLKDGLKVLKNGGLHFLKTEIVELSFVCVPANIEATILSVKTLDAPHLAATGHHLPGAAGSLPIVRAEKAARPMTTAEQITAFENTRAAKAARMTALMEKAADAGVTLDQAETEEYDGLELEIKSIDAHLVRLHALEKTHAAAATAITAKTATEAAAQRGGQSTPVLQVKANVPAGTAFVRYTCAHLLCKGNRFEAAEYAKRWDDSTPEVALALKAAVAPGNTTDAAWASPLVNQNISADFLELLRPATILGKISGLRTVPFNTKVPAQTAGGTYGWVGEAKPKPVTQLAFSAETLGIAKAAGIIVLTEELVRLSNPSAEALVRADMIAGIAQFLDQQFIDPAVAAVAGVNPASITNGAPTAAATTNPLADFLALMNHFAVNNIPVAGLTFIMSEANALALSFQMHHDGTPMFPDITITGGNFKGIRIITSQAAGGLVIALQPSYILYADDGGVTIDASREASLQMDSAPASPPDATTVLVSLWQNNLVGLRAERFVNWKRANTNAVKYLTAASYPAPAQAQAQAAPVEPL